MSTRISKKIILYTRKKKLRSMKERMIIGRLKDKAIFSVQDVQRIGESSREYAKLTLNRLLKRMVINKVTKNSYTLQKDILVIASNLKIPSYISFWSASSYYGFTEQLLTTVYVASTRRVKDIQFAGYRITFVKTKCFFGYIKIKTNTGELFVADQEKLLIDCFLHFKKMGNFDEIEKVFTQSQINKEKILEYLKKTNSPSLIKRVGYMLEQYKNIDLSHSFDLDRNYVFLNQFSKKYRRLNSKWRIKL